MLKLKWALLFTALTVFLTACPGTEPPPPPPPAAKITLTANPASIAAAGGTVKLTVKVDSGTVTDFDFQENGASVKKGKELTFDRVVPANTGAAKQLKYKVVGTIAGGTVASNEVSVTQAAGTVTPPPPGGPGSGATVQATTLQQIKDAPENANIVVGQNILCNQPNQDAPTPQAPDGDPCITLKPGQKLAAGTAGITITADIPAGVFGNSNNEAKVTVVKMANNTAVEGFTFAGEDIYTAIEAVADVTGPVFIKDVTISVLTANAPIRMQSVGEVTITGFNMPDTTRPTNIEGFTNLTIGSSSVGYTLAATATNAFLIAAGDGTVSVDGLTVKSNIGGLNFSPLLINKVAGTGATNVTVKNSRVEVPVANIADAKAFDFNIDAASTGTMTIDSAASIGNTTNSTYQFKDTYDTGVTGQITVVTQ